jgi:MFS family permease
MFGKLYATFPLKTIFLCALGLFEVGSIFCAAAPNSVTLIIGRAIAGIGCAGVLCGGVVIITVSLPLHKRPKYAGIFSAASGVAQILAPTLGGVFTDRATWRWCFWINLPLGAVTAAVVLFLVRMPDRPTAEEEQDSQFGRLRSFFSKLDVMGTVLLMPCMVCLNLALQWGGTTLPWSNWRVILCLSMFGVTFVFWCYVQYSRGDEATLPVRIMKQRSVASGVWFSFSHGALRSLIIYYIPIWFQVVKDTNAEQSGINFLAASIAMVVSVILTGQLVRKDHYKHSLSS